MKMWKVILLVTALLFIADMTFAQGCSQCKLIAEQSTANFNEVDESSFGHNINYGIMLLMILPYIVLFIFFRKRIFRLFKSLTAKM
tara:strand:+ start:5088 stop:5345 length:258 start_codon:yes stop_codon:yes gene_type:complete